MKNSQIATKYSSILYCIYAFHWIRFKYIKRKMDNDTLFSLSLKACYYCQFGRFLFLKILFPTILFNFLFIVICFCSRPVTKTSKTQIWSENVNAKTSFQVMSTLLSSRDIVLKIYCAQVCSPTQWSKANRWPPV